MTSILNELPAGAAPELVRTVGHLAGVMIDIAKRIARAVLTKILPIRAEPTLEATGKKRST